MKSNIRVTNQVFQIRVSTNKIIKVNLTHGHPVLLTTSDRGKNHRKYSNFGSVPRIGLSTKRFRGSFTRNWGSIQKLKPLLMANSRATPIKAWKFYRHLILNHKSYESGCRILKFWKVTVILVWSPDSGPKTGAKMSVLIWSPFYNLSKIDLICDSDHDSILKGHFAIQLESLCLTGFT